MAAETPFCKKVREFALEREKWGDKWFNRYCSREVEPTGLLIGRMWNMKEKRTAFKIRN